MNREPPGAMVATQDVRDWLDMTDNQFHYFRKKHGIRNAGIRGKYLKKDIEDALNPKEHEMDKKY